MSLSRRLKMTVKQVVIFFCLTNSSSRPSQTVCCQRVSASRESLLSASQCRSRRVETSTLAPRKTLCLHYRCRRGILQGMGRRGRRPATASSSTPSTFSCLVLLRQAILPLESYIFYFLLRAGNHRRGQTIHSSIPTS